jgi:UDP-N-acetylmuramate--alanine ligase
LVYIDDYAHHPTEIEAVYLAVRELYPNKKILVIFQPHLYSRTKDFADDFANKLSQFDTIFLLDIYPARELPIQGVTSAWLLSKIANHSKKMITKDELIAEVLNNDAEIIITLGAGDIGTMVKPLKDKLYEKVF